MEHVNVNINLHRNHQSNAKKWRVNSVRMELQIVEKMVLAYPTLCKTISIHALNIEFLIFWLWVWSKSINCKFFVIQNVVFHSQSYSSCSFMMDPSTVECWIIVLVFLSISSLFMFNYKLHFRIILWIYT